MNENNKIIAQEISKQLLSKLLILETDKSVEMKIGNGTIKENDWKLIFEQQIRHLEASGKIENS
jgi:hypothetical protein